MAERIERQAVLTEPCPNCCFINTVILLLFYTAKLCSGLSCNNRQPCHISNWYNSPPRLLKMIDLLLRGVLLLCKAENSEGSSKSRFDFIGHCLNLKGSSFGSKLIINPVQEGPMFLNTMWRCDPVLVSAVLLLPIEHHQYLMSKRVWNIPPWTNYNFLVDEFSFILKHDKNLRFGRSSFSSFLFF